MAPSIFYKILLDPSSRHLRLPTAYVNNHLEINKILNGPIIISVNGGYSWQLKIKQIGDSYCFTNGWKNVVEDIPLGFADFLMFRAVDQSTFNMLIHGPNGCEKLLPPKPDYDGGDDSVDEDYETDDDDDEKNKDDDPVFTKIITNTHKIMLRFPAKFAVLVGIDGEGTMTVKNVDGREWVTGLRVENSNGTNRYYLSTCGWRNFRRENDLLEGDECVFKYIRSENKLLLSKVNKKACPEMRPPRSGETSGDGGGGVEVAKRPRGRPRKG